MRLYAIGYVVRHCLDVLLQMLFLLLSAVVALSCDSSPPLVLPHASFSFLQVVGNIPGQALKTFSDLSAGSTVSPFHGPSPSSFSHRSRVSAALCTILYCLGVCITMQPACRYGQFLFEQPQPQIEYTLKNATYIGQVFCVRRLSSLLATC